MRLRPLALALCFAALPVLAQQTPPAEAPAPPALEDPDAGNQEAGAIPLAEIRRFVTTYNAIRHAYVEPVEDAKLMHSAVRGLLLDLDPHSVYFNAEEARDFNQDTSGSYEGVGLELLQSPGPTLRIVSTLEGGPGERAGLQSGDGITAIDGKPISPDNASAPLRGPAGSEVRITVERSGRDAPFEVTLVRERIQMQSVRSRLLEPGYAYVRIASFQSGTGEDFVKAVAALKAENRAPLKGLVLDLRNNGGGLLAGAIRIADELLDSGLIVTTRGRGIGGEVRNQAHPGDLLSAAPIMVLVDAGSASASEVLAGALRDNGRARIIGSRTFGKGSVQSFLPLDNGDAVKLTTARYYTPSGRSIQGVGIVPDVELQPEGEPAGEKRPYNEASLPGHLTGEEEDTRLAGQNAGHNLPGEGPVKAALAALKAGPVRN